MTGFDVATFREHFPALNQETVYLDSAATALKPQVVCEASLDFYQSAGTVHRSQHMAAQKLTARYEQARQQVAQFIGAESEKQIIWTRGTTEAINLVAQGWLANRLQPQDEILVSEMEHHANLLPWLMVAQRTGAKVVKWPLDDHALPDMAKLPELLTEKTKLVAVSQMSNVTGAMPDLAAIIAQAHAKNIKVCVDGAQGVVHQPVNMQQMGADFYAFSAHKLYGPTGLGVLYVAPECLTELTPIQGGGKMITEVNFDGFQLQPAPWCFEAGTPNIAGVCGFSAALEFVEQMDRSAAEAWSLYLADYTEQALASLPGFQSYRCPGSSLLAFNFSGIHPADLITLLAEQNIALRAGQHCAQPLMQALGISGTLRASFAPYNTQQDADALIAAIRLALTILNEEL